MSQAAIDAAEVDQSDATDVRYGMRSLLISMAVLAVLLTALGAFVRAFPADVRPRLALYWGVLCMLLGTCVAYNARTRFAAERQAGVVRFRLLHHSYMLPRMPGLGRTALGAVFLVCGPFIWAAQSFLIADNSVQLWIVPFDWSSYVGVGGSAAGIMCLWWRSVRMCDHGFITRNELISWDNCSRWYWDAVYGDVMVITFNQSMQKVALRVPKDQREAVETFVATNLASRRD